MAQGGGFSATPADIAATGGSVGKLSSALESDTATLVSAFGDAESAVGDPTAALSVSTLLEVCASTVGLLAPLVSSLGDAITGSSTVYSETDGDVCRATR